jgi:hypothetical protein
MRRLALLLALLALAAVLVGSAAGAAGFRRHAVPGEKVSLAVPAAWVVADSRLPAPLVDRLSRENPKLAPFLASLRSKNVPTKFIALDPAVRNGFATNANVVAVPVGDWVSFDYYRQALPLQVRNVAAGRLEQRVVRIDGVRAVRLRYRLRLHLGREFTAQTLQYAFLHKGRSVVVTYTTLPSLSSRYARTFAASAASIRFGG